MSNLGSETCRNTAENTVENKSSKERPHFSEFGRYLALTIGQVGCELGPWFWTRVSYMVFEAVSEWSLSREQSGPQKQIAPSMAHMSLVQLLYQRWSAQFRVSCVGAEIRIKIARRTWRYRCTNKGTRKQISILLFSTKTQQHPTFVQNMSILISVHASKQLTHVDPQKNGRKKNNNIRSKSGVQHRERDNCGEVNPEASINNFGFMCCPEASISTSSPNRL